MDNGSFVKKIIHVDMDAFFAAIEIRDNPSLKGRAVAVGGDPKSRGVIATASYEARKQGVKSALASARAIRLCPELVIIHPNFKKYKEASIKIREIFSRFTDLVEPLSLDEAYLDVTGSDLFNGSATLAAKKIRALIFKETRLTASAGIAPNKFLAKVASDWKKPNGQFLIAPNMIEQFVKNLQVGKIPGVGKVTNEKMRRLGIKTCGDLQTLSLSELMEHFGSFGNSLFYRCKGIDNRDVMPRSERKSLSVERTFAADLQGIDQCLEKVPILYEEFLKRLENYRKKENKKIKTLQVKLRFSDFTSTTVEYGFENIGKDNFIRLFKEGLERKKLPVRLMGLGVKFADPRGPLNSSYSTDQPQLPLFS